MARAFLGRWLAGLLLTGSAASTAATAADRMNLTLEVAGIPSTAFHYERKQDAQHSCEFFGGAGAAEQILVLRFNAPSYSILEPSDFGFSLWISGPAGTTWHETDPSTSLQVSIQGQIFFGTHKSDPAFRLQVTAEPDGMRGTFSASHVLDPATGKTIDLNGLWHCSPTVPDGHQKLTVEPAELTASASSPAATPEHSSHGRRNFRVYHRTPCEGVDCSTWTVTDAQSGESFTTSMKIKTHALSASVLREVQNGQLELWISGTQRTNASGKPILTAWRLEKVMPRQDVATRQKR